MPGRASGFCIYNDPALAIARAREAGLRVLYIDLDVHHGDGVQAIHWADPAVLTVSIHETGRYLFPGTGGENELGDGTAAGTVVNVPFEPSAGEGAWLGALRTLLPELAAGFAPDLIVSQHGCDSHAWDPLAHLRITTTAMSEAARLVDTLAHRYAGGRWLATGGGGYDVYRVVPRAWSLVWLAGSHREVPDTTDPAWRTDWADEAARYGQGPPPTAFLDPANAGMPVDAAQQIAEERSRGTVAAVRQIVVPRLLRRARDRGWWDPMAPPATAMTTVATPGVGHPALLPRVEPHVWERLTLAPRVLPLAEPGTAHALILAALHDGAAVSAAIEGTTVVGLAVTRHADDAARVDVLAIGVAPEWRRRGLGTRLLNARLESSRPGDADVEAALTVAERDPIEPLDGSTRAAIARQILSSAGFDVTSPGGAVAAADPTAIRATRRA
jgi:GNAT superfamily N-acetyltransferase